MYRKLASLLFLCALYKSSTSNKGFVTEVLQDRKYDCPAIGKRLFAVKSEIQCTHRCLQNNECKMLNYNTEKESKENCEFITNLHKCTTKAGMRGWKALLFQVVDVIHYFAQVRQIT